MDEVDDDDDIYRAMQLGRLYRGVASHLPQPVPESITVMLPRLDAAFSSLRDMCDFVLGEDSWKRPEGLAFFAQYPLDRVLMWLQAEPDLLRTEERVHHMVQTIGTSAHRASRIFVYQCVRERLVAGLPIVEVLTERNRATPCMKQCIDLLLYSCGTNRDLVRDPSLFRVLATYVHHSDLRRSIMRLLKLGNLYSETLLVEDVFVALTGLVVRNRLGGDGDDVLQCLETMMTKNPDFCTERFVTHTAELWRTGWPVEIGPIVAHLLDTNNVALIVEWDRTGRLTSLAVAAHAHATVEWRVVRSRLRHLVPERVRIALGEPARAAATTNECWCPITLERIVDPVSLSDGHTYERDAIMRHLAHAGFVSPLTRERLAPYVFPNRAVVAP